MLKTGKYKKPAKFYPYSPPYKPSPPSETILEWQEFAKLSLNDYDGDNLPDLPTEQHIEIKCKITCDDNVGHSVNLSFGNYVNKPNTYYNQLKQRYDADLLKYKTDKIEWDKQKAEYDREQKLKSKTQQLALYEKLKKEFEG